MYRFICVVYYFFFSKLQNIMFEQMTVYCSLLLVAHLRQSLRGLRILVHKKNRVQDTSVSKYACRTTFEIDSRKLYTLFNELV